MHEAAEAEAAEISGVATGGCRSLGFEREERRWASGKRTHLETDSDTGVARSGLEPDAHSKRRRHLPAGGATRWVALRGGRIGNCIERRPASQAGEDARRQAAGCDRSDGVRAITGGLLAVDHRADRAGSEAAKDCRQGRARDHSQVVCQPRAEAVA